MKNKVKTVYKLEIWFRHPKTKNEIISNSDPDYKDFVRAKRKWKHLPTSWDDIHISCINKSWKSRSKVQKQYIKHKHCIFEERLFGVSEITKREFLYKLTCLKKKDNIGWYYFDKQDRYTYNYIDLHKTALDLYKTGYLIAEMEKFEYDILTRNGLIHHIISEDIIRCRLP